MPAGSSAPASLEQLRADLLAVVMELGYQRHDEPLQLASGELSRDFIDAKAACASGRNLALACRTMWALAEDAGAEVNAVGGLTLGADHFSHGIAILFDLDWFTVRKQEKGRGTNQRIEGRRLQAGDRVLLVDDVVTTGGSIVKAYEAVRGTGAAVAMTTALVDRGHAASRFFRAEGVPYQPVFTFEDLGIEPIGNGSGVAAASS